MDTLHKPNKNVTKVIRTKDFCNMKKYFPEPYFDFANILTCIYIICMYHIQQLKQRNTK